MDNQPEVSIEEAAPAPEPGKLALGVLQKCMRISKLVQAVDLSVGQLRYVATDEEWAELLTWHYGKHVDQFFVDGITVLPGASIVVPAPNVGQKVPDGQG